MMRELLKKLDNEFKVEKIKYNGIHLWPFLRPYVIDAILIKEGDQSSETTKIDFKIFFLLVKSFFYGLPNLFKNHTYLVFSMAERRKKINGVYHDRVAQGISELFPEETLFIENPLYDGHYSIKELPTQRIMSQSPLLILSYLIGRGLFRIHNIAGLNVYKELLMAYGIELDIKVLTARFLGQYYFTKFLLKFYKPKKVFFVNLQNLLGCVKAFKERGILVYELQHGIINHEHPSYNYFIDFKQEFSPDILTTFSEREKKLFKGENFFLNQEQAIPLGYYFLSLYKNKEPGAALTKIRQINKKILVYSSQDIYDHVIIPFLCKVALLDKSLTILIKLRHRNLTDLMTNLPVNMKVMSDYSIYELLTIADVHCTVSSTCAIEAPFFNLPNVLINYQNYAHDYYGEMIRRNVSYVETPAELLVAFNKFHASKNALEDHEVFFNDHYMENLKRLLDGTNK
jgi:hypothetical protein